MNDILYRNIIPDKNTLIRDSVEILTGLRLHMSSLMHFRY